MVVDVFVEVVEAVAIKVAVVVAEDDIVEVCTMVFIFG